MAALPQPFDANAVEPIQPFEIIPEGKYPLSITDSEMKDTKDGGGRYLQLVAEVIDGQRKGRKLWIRLNLINRNQTAVDIAQRELSALCRAVGVMSLTDSTELHGRPFLGLVKIRQQAGREPQNEVRGYERLGSGATAPSHADAARAGLGHMPPTTDAVAGQTAAQPAPTTSTPPPPAGNTPPWMAKAG